MNAALQLDSGLSKAYYHRALAKAGLRKSAEAQDDLNSALQHDTPDKEFLARVAGENIQLLEEVRELRKKIVDAERKLTEKDHENEEVVEIPSEIRDILRGHRSLGPQASVE